MLLTGRTVDAAEAEDWGLVARRCDPADLLDTATDALEWCCRTAPVARRAVTRTMDDFYGAYDRATMEDSLAGPEPVEGFAAFKERRSPAWVPPPLRLDRGASERSAPVPYHAPLMPGHSR